MKARYWLQLAAVASALSVSGVAMAVDAGPNVGQMQHNPDAATSKHGAVSAPGASSQSAATPARTDSPDDAWAKLGYKGFITKDDVKGLQGFSFDAADMNHDGQLSQDEFRAAWSTYRAPAQSSGSKPMTNPSTSSPGMAPSGSSSSNSSTATNKGSAKY